MPSTRTAWSRPSWSWLRSTVRPVTRRRSGWSFRERFTALGCEVTIDDIGNLVATYPGTRPDTVLISTHMDTAGTDVGIRPIIEDGIIKTDGSTILGADDKSGIAGCLELLTLLHDHPEVEHPSLEFVVSVGEESGLVGSASDGRQQAEIHLRLRLRHRGRDQRDHLLGADLGVHHRHRSRQEGPRRRRAGEGDQCREGRRRGHRCHAPGSDRRGDRRQHRDHQRR